jgi:hypothetical protein
MDLRDKELDAWISAALQPGTTVSTQRKHQLRQQINQRAAHQKMLSALSEEETPRLTQRVWAIGQFFCNWVSTLVVDEAQYERARQSHYAFRYGGPSRDGRLVLQFMNPMGFNLVSPSI